jgi:hypothetical protein
MSGCLLAAVADRCLRLLRRCRRHWPASLRPTKTRGRGEETSRSGRNTRLDAEGPSVLKNEGRDCHCMYVLLLPYNLMTHQSFDILIAAFHMCFGVAHPNYFVFCRTFGQALCLKRAAVIFILIDGHCLVSSFAILMVSQKLFQRCQH